MVWPRPDSGTASELYEQAYFSQRTDRGYNDYFSENLRREITRVLTLNLHDTGFFQWEKKLGHDRSVLDIGCAAGYSVAFMAERGWRSSGIDVSKVCVAHARGTLNLDVTCGNYLMQHYEPLDLITLWATIEHLDNPRDCIAKFPAISNPVHGSSLQPAAPAFLISAPSPEKTGGTIMFRNICTTSIAKIFHCC
jgi:2-polyprenyl-3-methyl-5-hydroxy-6-metoxy-1,4-benzoquinol methylase